MDADDNNEQYEDTLEVIPTQYDEPDVAKSDNDEDQEDDVTVTIVEKYRNDAREKQWQSAGTKH